VSADFAAAEKKLAEWGKLFGWTPDPLIGKYQSEEPVKKNDKK
jgi:hypothetical protein